MSPHQILHIDDDDDIRAVVAMCLERDGEFSVRSCASGEEGIEAAASSAPDLILLDVMMPIVDGPATLRRLRGNPETAGIPIVIMTARGQKHEFGRFRSFGAVDVIAKPFDPNTLAALVRRHLPPMEPDAIEGQFLHRLRSDAETMAKYRESLKSDPTSSVALEGAQACAHKLAGAAGVFGFQTVSFAAESLEGSIIDRRAGRGASRTVEILLDSLLDCLERK